jgi:hypothetical protein
LFDRSRLPCLFPVNSERLTVPRVALSNHSRAHQKPLQRQSPETPALIKQDDHSKIQFSFTRYQVRTVVVRLHKPPSLAGAESLSLLRVRSLPHLQLQYRHLLFIHSQRCQQPWWTLACRIVQPSKISLLFLSRPRKVLHLPAYITRHPRFVLISLS